MAGGKLSSHPQFAIGSQVAVYQGAEEIDEEPEVLLHMIYMYFPNYIRTVLFFDDGSSCSSTRDCARSERHAARSFARFPRLTFVYMVTRLVFLFLTREKSLYYTKMLIR